MDVWVVRVCAAIYLEGSSPAHPKWPRDLARNLNTWFDKAGNTRVVKY